MNTTEIRFGWIEASLRYGGAFGPREKSAYLRNFGVSESAMSRHQSRFAKLMEEFVGRQIFERNQKKALKNGRLTLLPIEDLPKKSLFPMPELDRWLEDSIGPQFERVVVPVRRLPDAAVLREIITAIRSKKPLVIEYMSRSGAENARIISPHVLVDVVGRYHVRAFDHAKNRYGDFVLARVRRCYPPAEWRRAPFVGPGGDEDWQRKDKISIEALASHLSEGVRVDWGLNESWTRRVCARRALIPYLIDDTDEGYESPVRVVRDETDFQHFPSQKDPRP